MSPPGSPPLPLMRGIVKRFPGVPAPAGAGTRHAGLVNGLLISYGRVVSFIAMPVTGGRGTPAGSILGLLIFTVITNLFVLNGLNTSDQLIAKGVIIVIAVLLQRRGLRTPT